MNKKIVFKMIGLELLLMFFYTLNGAYVSITQPSSPFLQFVLLVPLALGLLIYIAFQKKWADYFFWKVKKVNVLLYVPLILILCIIIIDTKGLNVDSYTNLLLMFLMQILVVAFIEETVYRGIMLRILLAKGTFTAVIISSLLFGMTHMLRLVGGQSIRDTIIQIIYAFLVGLVLSLLIMDGHSILITIIFHGFNNFFNFMGNVESSLSSGLVIIFVLFVYMIFLWKQVKKKALIQ